MTMMWDTIFWVVLALLVIFVGAMGWLKRLTLWELLQGMGTTQKTFLERKVTVQFPEEELPRSPRHRGMLALRRYPNGEERCIACKLCEAVCPALAITIEAEPREDDQTRRTKRFDIDMFKCINCGLCEEACPVDSIVLTPAIHYTPTERGQNILTKEKLLTIGDQYEKQLAADRDEDKDFR
jgi:NADH-quinone oxidoreductase subunit I